MKKLDKFIKEIDVDALGMQGKTISDVSIKVDEEIFLEVKSSLDADGCYKGFKIYV